MTKSIEIRDAHEHNLRHVNLSIPRDSIVVVTGVSGSGKSSLAFDTVFQEGDRLTLFGEYKNICTAFNAREYFSDQEE